MAGPRTNTSVRDITYDDVTTLLFIFFFLSFFFFSLFSKRSATDYGRQGELQPRFRASLARFLYRVVAWFLRPSRERSYIITGAWLVGSMKYRLTKRQKRSVNLRLHWPLALEWSCHARRQLQYFLGFKYI